MERQYGKITPGENQVVCQKWEESERGWGIRPDGFSLHISRDALVRFMREVYEPRMKDTFVPAEYDRPDGSPYVVGISDEEYSVLVAKGGSERYFSNYTTPGNTSRVAPVDLSELRLGEEE